jgi:5S rRNA maturation endonuclease (ribonuclease M5)
MTYNNHVKLNELTSQACNVIEDVMDELGIEYHSAGNRLYGPCPIHGGDNPGGFSLYPQGEIVGGYWQCFTRKCEGKWKKTLIGFIHGVLSAQQSRDMSWTEAVDWLCNFLGYDSLDDIDVPDAQELSRRRYSAIHNKIRLLPRQSTSAWTRQDIRAKLQIPSEYYLNRGYSQETLDKYDVGWYNRVQRVVVPVYDDDYRYAVGFTGRSPHNKCPKCSWWHDSLDKCHEVPKWLHSKGFNASKYLYNYWFAKDHIRDSLSVILVEGPGDVWKLAEGGIHNAVAMFGVELTDDQRFVVEQSGAMSAIVLMDNDEAGIEGAMRLREQLGRFLRLYFPTFEGNDVGELNTNAITKDIKPILNKITRVYQ